VSPFQTLFQDWAAELLGFNQAAGTLTINCAREEILK
jgi:hypothetical protein